MSIPREGSRNTDKGLLVSCAPDWCWTPAGKSKVLIPYRLWAKQQDDANTAPTVRQTGKRSHTSGSLITVSHGDEPGSLLGLTSGTKESVCWPVTWSQTVRIEGKHAVRHNDLWAMNNGNTCGKLMFVEDVKVYEEPKADTDGATSSSHRGPQSTIEALTAPRTSQIDTAGSWKIAGAMVAPSSTPSSPNPVNTPNFVPSNPNTSSPGPSSPPANDIGGSNPSNVGKIVGAARTMVAAVGAVPVFLGGVIAALFITPAHAPGLPQPVPVPAPDNVRVTKRVEDDDEKEEECKRLALISRTVNPETAAHIADAQMNGHPSVLTIDRPGAGQRRSQALRDYPARTGYDRDEYPPAMFSEGGTGASVRYISPSDNRSAGAIIGAQTKGATEGCKVTIKVIP